jgi:hypothetical protein
MLIHANPHTGKAAAIPGQAHIVIAIGNDGRLHLQSFRMGDWDSSYADSSDAVLQRVPALLAELRQHIAAPQLG